MDEKEPGTIKSLGEAIDELIKALQPLSQESRLTAIRAACDHLKIHVTGKDISTGSQPAKDATSSGSTPTIPRDIRNLKDEKQPTSANEMATLVAYYLAELAPETDRKTEVTVDDMTKYFKQAAFPLPKSPDMLLQNAKAAGYFDVAKRGFFRLNPVGFNLAAYNLPHSGTATINAAAKSRKKRRRKKTSRGK